MQNDISNLRATIIPKSDQLNADQLLGQDMIVTITGVSLASSPDQPVIIHYEAKMADHSSHAKQCARFLSHCGAKTAISG